MIVAVGITGVSVAWTTGCVSAQAVRKKKVMKRKIFFMREPFWSRMRLPNYNIEGMGDVF